VAESGWFIAGVVIGVVVGILVGFALSRYISSAQFQQPLYASVVFERDESGRITAIHYVSGVKSGRKDS
jgi:hypothetical protein